MEVSSDSSPRVVLTTVTGADQARTLARMLVESGLAACVSFVEGVTSTYRWRGRIEEERETLILVKTTSRQLSGLQAFLQTHHPYEVPEILALEASSESTPYLRWLTEATGKEERP